MQKLTTISQSKKLNNIYVLDDKIPSNMKHVYMICKNDADILDGVIADIQFQKGTRTKGNTSNGILDTDLLEIVRHRLQCFQTEAPSNNEYSTRALKYIEEALYCIDAMYTQLREMKLKNAKIKIQQ